MKTYLIVIAACLVVLLQSCSESKGSDTGENSVTYEKVYELAEVISQRPEFSLTLPGELKPFEEVSIYAKMKGFIKKIYVDRGDKVQKGQLLALLEAPEITSQAAARNSSSASAYQTFLFSKQSYERLKTASQKHGAVAGIELERAYAKYLGDSAAYNSMKAELQASRQLESYLQIRAPFSGVITSRYFSEGALVGENTNGLPLFQLSKANKLRLIVAIPEKQSQTMDNLTKASFTLIDYPGDTFTAQVSRNSQVLDQSTKSVLTEFDIENPDGQFRAGQYAKVKLSLQRKQATLWVPTSSIVDAQSGIFLIKADDQKATRIQVQKGISQNGLTEVYGALKEGDRIVKTGSEEIKEGTTLKTNE